MNKIVSQAELDALLQSVSTPPLDPHQVPSLENQTISENQENSSAMLMQQSKLASSAAAEKITAYDFRRPDRVPKTLLHSLQLLHDKFCTNVSSSLSAYLRTVTEVSLRSVEQTTYTEFVGSLSDPTCMNAISIRPLSGAAALEVNLDLVFPLIDRLLGGPGHAPTVSRNITEIEKNILQGVLQMITTNLSEAWRPVTEVNFNLYSSETRPQLLQIISPNEVVVLFSFDVKLGEAHGVIHFCIPYSSLEPVRGKFEQETEIRPRGNHQADLKKIINVLRSAPVVVSVELPRTMITIRDLLSIKVKDIVCLDSEVGENILLLVAGKSKYQGQMVTVNDRKTIRVVRMMNSGN